MSRTSFSFLVVSIQSCLCLYLALGIEIGISVPEIPTEYYTLLLISFLSSVLVYYSLFSSQSNPISTSLIVSANMVLPIVMISIINTEAGFHIVGKLDDDGLQVIDNDAKNSVYFSIVTFTTLGYGDVQPVPSMKIFASLVAICGYVNLGLLISLISYKASNQRG